MRAHTECGSAPSVLSLNSGSSPLSQYGALRGFLLNPTTRGALHFRQAQAWVRGLQDNRRLSEGHVGPACRA